MALVLLLGCKRDVGTKQLMKQATKAATYQQQHLKIVDVICHSILKRKDRISYFCLRAGDGLGGLEDFTAESDEDFLFTTDFVGLAFIAIGLTTEFGVSSRFSNPFGEQMNMRNKKSQKPQKETSDCCRHT
jgi:hypothetical protein